MSITTTTEQISREARKHKIQKLFRYAERMGVIKRGWSYIDYVRAAINRNGWESTCINGMKGSFKSNLMMQHGTAIYGTIDIAKKYIVTETDNLIDHLQHAINNEITLPWIGIDDAAAIFPKSLYFTNRQLYSKLQASWEPVRTAINSIEFTCVLKHKVASFLLEDITGDIKCYNPISTEGGEPIKGYYDYRRWMWLRNLKDPTKDIAKPMQAENTVYPATPYALTIDKELQQNYIFAGKQVTAKEYFQDILCLSGVTREAYKEYWKRRREITKKSFEDFTRILDNIKVKEAQQKEKQEQQKLTAEERSAINRNNGEKGRETQKRNREQQKKWRSGENGE